jgi:hypothetical protein
MRVLRFAVVGAVIFLAGGVVGAVVQPFLRTRAAPLPATPAPTTPHEPGAHRRKPHAPAAGQESPLPEIPIESTPVEIPTKDEAPAAAPTPVLPAFPARNKPKPSPLRLAALQPAVPPPQPAPSIAAEAKPAPQMDEQSLIFGALAKLRTSHQPEAALALLDDYRARFPGGVLAVEAARLRREALLLMGRKMAVLDELEQSPSLDASTGDERVLRGELRASAGRWQAALADFEAIVRVHPNGAESDDLRERDRLERALWGRALVRSHLGDDDAVCVDLGEYLRRFPHGRFAAQAKQLFDKECEP